MHDEVSGTSHMALLYDHCYVMVLDEPCGTPGNWPILRMVAWLSVGSASLYLDVCMVDFICMFIFQRYIDPDVVYTLKEFYLRMHVYE